MPEQFLAIAVVLVFSIWLKAFPSQLSEEPGSTAHGLSHVWDVTQHAVLPVLTLTASILASWSLIMRASLSRDAARADYMTTARAIGLSPRRAVLRHAVPNALLPVIALTAMSLGYVVGGVIFIESVFSWPGIGQLTYDALTQPRPARAAGRLPALVGRRDPHEPARRPDHHGPRPARAGHADGRSRRETVARLLGARAQRRSRARCSRAVRAVRFDRPPPARGVRAGHRSRSSC